jgi:fatty acid desaturase
LPRECYRRSTWGALAFIGFVLALWWVPALLAVWVARGDALVAWQKVPLVVALGFVAGQGFHLSGWVGHEGFHFNLFRSRLASAIVGIVVSSVTVVFIEVGVAIEHVNHHRYANTERDPDVPLFSKQRGFWSRLFLTRTRANRAFARAAWRLLWGKPLEMEERWLPFTRRVYARLAALNFACCALWFAIYVCWGLRDPLSFACCVGVPLMFANIYSGLRPYIEHSQTDAGLTTCARSRSHWFYSFWYFGNAYHLEHHLYPMVPCYRLPWVHRHLIALGFLSESHVGFEPDGLRGYRWALARHQYGSAADSAGAP